MVYYVFCNPAREEDAWFKRFETKKELDDWLNARGVRTHPSPQKAGQCLLQTYGGLDIMVIRGRPLLLREKVAAVVK